MLFQRILLPVGDWYEQCGFVGTWAKHGVCLQQKALQWRWEEEVEITNGSSKNWSSKGKICKDPCLSHNENHGLKRFMLLFILNDYADNHQLRTSDISPENNGSFITRCYSCCFELFSFFNCDFSWMQSNVENRVFVQVIHEISWRPKFTNWRPKCFC